MAAPNVKGLNCPSCGAALEIRSMQHAVNVVCPHCLSVLDAKDPNVRILQQFTAQERIQPLIPLGARGKWRGDPWEAIGFQVRTIHVEGLPYSWHEYLLFNPYKGFRYLTQYQGHWNDVTVLRTLPETMPGGAKLLGRAYRHFQTSGAVTTYVMGEFPWQVRVNEHAAVADYVSPPQMLSSETTENEVVWSLGEYTTGKRVWEAFGLKGGPPPAVGVFANQPSPFRGGVGQIWGMFTFLFACLIALAIATFTFSQREQVYHNWYSFSPESAGEASFVTPTFQLKGRPSDVEIDIHTTLSNSWAYFNLALINSDNGQAYDFGREVSYYFGRDSDGSWSEGGPNDSALVPTVPAGNYYLRVEPEMDKNAPTVQYEITIRRDVPALSFFWIAALLLAVPPVFVSFRSLGFERRRWSESDHPPVKLESD
jgi:hypothetical protein